MIMMKRLVLAAVGTTILGLIFLAGFVYGKKWEGYKVTRVVDGDTLSVVNLRDGRAMRLRIWAINAPDQRQCYVEEARIELERQLNEKKVRFEIFGYDGYGRILAKVLVDGKDLAEMLVKSGSVKVYDAAEVHDELKPSLDYVNILRKAEDGAKASKLGIWGNLCKGSLVS